MVSYVDSFLGVLAPLEGLAAFPQYPSGWFEKNPGQKPPVELPVMECTLEQVRTTIRHYLLNNRKHSLNRDLVLLYFRKLAGDMRASLDTDWISFGITIGRSGSEVGPLDLVDVKDRTIEVNLKPEVTAVPEDDLWILAALASVFCYSASADMDDDAIGAEISKQWEDVGFKKSQFKGFRDDNRVLVDVPAYRIMIAVFDMFLFKFSDHKLSPARNLTSISRFQGFAALQSLRRLCALINKSSEEVHNWLLTPELQREYYLVHRPRQELDHPHSYTPYFMVLQLSRGSPYSEYLNPKLYMFANLVRALMNDREGRHAKMPEIQADLSVEILACIYAYILAPGEGQLDGLPGGSDIDGWVRWFNDHPFGWVPKALIQRLSHIWSAFEQDPPLSVGRMFYEHMPPSLIL